ncbi:RNA polymerase sigma factor [Stieleria marina]|uniref:RNA polymerase sigma factor n=1 Tax=Stieleria marina TaxID=1930275 RepID=UPI003AF3E4C9
MTTDESHDSVLSPSDRSLVVQVRDGDEEAATILYERYARRIFGLVRSNLGEKLAASTEPEDIVQSVFKSVFRGMQSGNYEAPPGATLWNLMAVIAMNKLRSKAVHHQAQRRDTERNVPLEQMDCIDAVPSDQSSIEFFEICVRETLELLRPLDREVLSLRIQGHAVDEISELVNRSCRSVERSLQNSRRRLAGILLNE